MTGIERHWHEEKLDRYAILRDRLDELAHEFPELKEDMEFLTVWFQSRRTYRPALHLFRSRYAGKF